MFDSDHILTYILRVRLLDLIDRKYVLLALVAAIFVSLCPIDHFVPLAEAHSHGRSEEADCPEDTCITTLSAERDLSKKPLTTQNLLRIPTLPESLFYRGLKVGLNTTEGPPGLSGYAESSSTLYQRHVLYLI